MGIEQTDAKTPEELKAMQENKTCTNTAEFVNIPENEEEFKAMVVEISEQDNYRKPLAFGLCRVDRSQVNPEKILQATFPIINWDKNFGSFAVFCKAAQLSAKELDFAENEWNIQINECFLNFALAMFTPYIEESIGDKHLNIQVVQAIKNEIENLKEDMQQYEKFGHAENMVEEIKKEMQNFYFTVLFDDTPVESVQTAYLKLMALSKADVSLRSLNLNGVFGKLHNCAWSGNTPYDLDYLRANEIVMKMQSTYPAIDFVDKFPRYLQHIIPADNVRILSTHNVRFGAQLHAGTTIMPGASYINFNAGTTGPVMVEGRISSSAIVGAGSDVGGGASILGVLSGTDGNPITIGKNTLLGTNSTTGIPLGDGCIIDSGIAVLAGTKFWIKQDEIDKITEVNPGFTAEKATKYENEQIPSLPSYLFKAKDLAGLNGLHFRQDSVNGSLIARRSTREVKLNEELH